jgi:hypothetical protein
MFLYLYYLQLSIIFAPEFRLRISMDRISDSDSEDAGSIPAGATTEQSRSLKPLTRYELAVLF